MGRLLPYVRDALEELAIFPEDGPAYMRLAGAKQALRNALKGTEDWLPFRAASACADNRDEDDEASRACAELDEKIAKGEIKLERIKGRNENLYGSPLLCSLFRSLQKEVNELRKETGKPRCGEDDESDERPRGEGRKDDSGKPRYDLMPVYAEHAVVQVLTYGAQKYAPDNWRKVPDPRSRYLAAARRHLAAWWQGETIDDESKLPHLAHAACCVLFLLELDLDAEAGVGEDEEHYCSSPDCDDPDCTT